MSSCQIDPFSHPRPSVGTPRERSKLDQLRDHIAVTAQREVAVRGLVDEREHGFGIVAFEETSVTHDGAHSHTSERGYRLEAADGGARADDHDRELAE